MNGQGNSSASQFSTFSQMVLVAPKENGAALNTSSFIKDPATSWISCLGLPADGTMVFFIVAGAWGGEHSFGVQARTIVQLKQCLGPEGPGGLLKRLYQEYVLQRAAGKAKGKGALARWGGRGRGRGRDSSSRGSGGRWLPLCPDA